MKKRMALFTAVLLAAALCAAMFAGCISSGNRNRDRDGNNPDAKKYTVTFNTGGGSAIASITADSGTIINKPADPARAGYAFDGWYTSAQYTRSVNFPFTLTQNVALYAKWTGSGGVEKAVLEIAVATPPSKTTYNAGETFNDAGLTLVVLYTDGSVVTITSGWALDKSPSDPLAPDDFYVVITFGGKTVPQSITVMPSNQSVWDIEIFAKPIKTQYTVGETFDTAGMVLRVTYADGSEVNITSGYTYNKTGPLTAADTSVTFSYGGRTVSYPITVSAPTFSWNLALAKYAVVLNVGQYDAVTVSGAAWASENPAIATVSGGIITGISPGYTFVTATTATGYGKISVWVRGTAAGTAISTPQQFLNIANSWNSSYYLTQDIDFAGVSMSPLGNKDVGTVISTANFGGVLDGRGYALKNINLEWPNSENAYNYDPLDYFDKGGGYPGREYLLYGIFKSLRSSAVIRNLNVTNLSVAGNMFMGGLVGKNAGTIENCYIEGRVTNYQYWMPWDAWDCPGGMIAGINAAGGAIRNCITKALPNDRGPENFGSDCTFGLVGWNLGSVQNSFAVADNLTILDSLSLPAAMQEGVTLVPLPGSCAFITGTGESTFTRYETASFGAQWVFEKGKIPYLIK